ncbi:MAG: hypothetical protein RIK87_10495 [Fuerstiella sp.]
MKPTENNSAPTIPYLIEHSHGTCELWVRQQQTEELTMFEPVRLVPISGRGTVLLKAEVIAQAIGLEEWMSEHMEVFEEGRTSYDK